MKFFAKTKDMCRGIVSCLQKRFLLFFFILFLIIIFAAGVIFYWYGLRAVNYVAVPSSKDYRIDTELLGKINSRFEKNKKEYENSANSVIPDPFR